MTSEVPRVGVGIIVIKKEKGRRYIMLHQRKRPLGRDYWGSGGGHLELGESLMDGALRELREEAGEHLVVKDVRFLGVMNFTQLKPKHYVDISFLATWVSGDPINSTPKATKNWRWFELDKLPSPLFPPVEKYLEALTSNQIFFDSRF